MRYLRELGPDECMELLRSQAVGRIGFDTPHGPQVLPVNLVVHGDAVYVRTSPYGQLGRFSRGTKVALEVDSVDLEHFEGWSVMVTGPATMVEDPEELQALRHGDDDPAPWAMGVRNLYIRLRINEVTGRRMVSSAAVTT